MRANFNTRLGAPLSPVEGNDREVARDIRSPGADLLAALFRDAPDEQFLHFRIIAPGGPVLKQMYLFIGELNPNGFDAGLPRQYDGQANVYYGVATRTRREGTGAAVGVATCIWFDEFTRPAPDLPQFSWLVETSPGKVQGGFFLKEPTTDLCRAEILSQRLGQAVGGDTVWDRARILRLPGFLNVKKEHPGHPRAFLLELNPDLRYTLEELEAALPPLVADDHDRPLREHTGPFNPHSGTPLAQADQARLAAFLKDLVLRRNSDGRYAGACPLPHKDGPTTSESNFYCSPITGFWHCFGSNHVGNHNGGVDVLRLIGFECEQAAGGELSLKEMAELLGTEITKGFFKEGVKSDVANTVELGFSLLTVFATFRSREKRGKRSTAWSDAVADFPYPKGVKPLTKSTVLYSARTRQMAVVDLLSNSWRNLINAQFKRRKARFNMLPKLRRQEVYCWRVAIDDWTPQGHKTMKQKLARVGAEFLWFDNGLRRGYYLYLSNVQIKGWEPVTDVVPVLVDALKAISPPGRDEDVPRFRPYGGSRGWAGGAMAPVEDDAGRWHVIAQSDSPTDWIQVEAELAASGIRYEQVEEYWQRSQWGPGIVADFLSEQEALDFVVSIGYAPTANSLVGALA